MQREKGAAWTDSPMQREGGAALIVALLVMTMVGLLASFLCTQVINEGKAVQQSQDGIRALYSAEAACVEIVARMADPASTSYVGPSTTNWASQPGWGIYFRTFNATGSINDPYANTAADGLDNDLDGSKDESGETYPTKYAASSDSMLFSWAKAKFRLNTSKKILRYGDTDGDPDTAPVANTSKGEPIVTVTGSATVGSVTRTVVMECVKLNPTDPYVVKSRRQL